jgi:hypothetical protein
VLFLIDPQVGGVASEDAVSSFALVKEHVVLCGVIALAIACLVSACASSKQEGVVSESTQPETYSPEAHFARPSFVPEGEGGVTAGHF